MSMSSVGSSPLPGHPHNSRTPPSCPNISPCSRTPTVVPILQPHYHHRVLDVVVRCWARGAKLGAHDTKMGPQFSTISSPSVGLPHSDELFALSHSDNYLNGIWKDFYQIIKYRGKFLVKVSLMTFHINRTI